MTANSNPLYKVDKEQMDSYLKKRFKWAMIRFVTIIIIVTSVLIFFLYKKHHFPGTAAWCFLFLIPLITNIFLFDVKRYHKVLREFFSETYFVLTADSIIQEARDSFTKEFKYSNLAIINKAKFGTTILKGNWLTKIDYYTPSEINYKLSDPNYIFIPSITSNYSELIEEIRSRRHKKSR